MADTPNDGETETTEPLENNATPPATPHIEEKKTDDSEIEKLRKEKEQIEMERNQLRNKLQAEEAAKAKAEQAKLEEKEEFKTLYEQSQEKLRAIEAEKEEEARKKAVSEAKDTILGEYSDEVKALAEDAGIDLGDATDASLAAFKERLDKIQTRLGVSGKVQSNNPGTPSPQTQYSREELREILADPIRRDAYYRAKGGVTAMQMAPQQ